LPDEVLAREALIDPCGVCGDALRGDDVRVADDPARCGNLAVDSYFKKVCTGTVAVPLEYKGRYNCQPGPDHLMGALGLTGDRALVGGNRGIALVDLTALPVGGTQNYLDQVSWGNPRDFTATKDEKHVFVNSALTGFTVMQIENNKLSQVASKSESGVYYEKMWLDGNHLYVAAHSYGIRIFDVTQPASPVLLGRIDQGFVDAFAIAVDGTTAYVADGGGGLKIVDVTNKSAPKILSGETAQTAVGTYEDVTVKNGRVYAAAGGAGLAVYEAGKLASRTVYPVQGCAESLCWIGGHLAVGTLTGVLVYAYSGSVMLSLLPLGCSLVEMLPQLAKRPRQGLLWERGVFREKSRS